MGEERAGYLARHALLYRLLKELEPRYVNSISKDIFEERTISVWDIIVHVSTMTLSGFKGTGGSRVAYLKVEGVGIPMPR